MDETLPDAHRRGDDPSDGWSNGVEGAPTETESYRVGVLSPHNSKETKAILNAVRALGHDPVWIRDANVVSTIDGGDFDLSPSVDVLVNRLLVTKSDDPLEDSQLAALYERRTPVLNGADAVRTAIHKYLAAATLSDAGLPVPDAFFARSTRSFDEWTDHLGGRAAHKSTVGTNGHGMRLVETDDPVSARIGDEASFLQEYLPGGDRPSDIRVYVVGDRVVGAMRRTAPDGDWRTNVALGGTVEDVTDEISATTRRVAREAAAALGLDVAGIDLFPSGNDCYVLEVNATAGFKGLFEATDVSAAPYIAALAVERAGGGVDDARVADLADDLDDSVPACKPGGDDVDDDAVLGYTTRIAVAGTDGSETVVAKSDTGAERTSVDTTLAGRIGAGPMVDTTEVRSAAGRGTETRPLVDVDLRVDDDWRTVTASVTDRDRMTHDVLLGRDVLAAYTLDVSRTATDESTSAVPETGPSSEE